MKASRILLSREKGSRLPVGAVSVARPHRWGNPFSVERYGRARAIELFRHAMEGGWSPDWVAEMVDEEALEVYETMSAFHKRIGMFPAEAARAELRGLALACWCRLNDACHADALIEIANA